MTTQVIVDGATAVNTNSLSAGFAGGASIPAVVSDASDASYVTATNFITGTVGLFLPAPTLPAGAIVESVHFILRRRVTASSNQPYPFYVFSLHAADNGKYGGVLHGITPLPGNATFTQAFNTSVQEGTSLLWTTFNDGSHIKDMNPATLLVHLAVYATSAGTGLELQRVQTAWRYNSVPVLTIPSAPADPSSTARPTVTWTYTDADLDPQRSVRVIVVPDGTPSSAFPYGTPGMTGYDPTGATTITWDSGQVTTAALSMQIATGLTNGVRYYVYVQATADPVAGQDQKSAWTGRAFTVTVTPPANPTFTVTADNTNARNRLQLVEGSTSTPHTARYDVERNTDGAGYVPVRSATFTAASTGYRLNGTASNGWDTPDRSTFTTANGLKVRWHGALADYTPSGAQVLVGQTIGAGLNKSWYLQVRTDGKVELQWSTDGFNWDGVATCSVANGTTDGIDIWFEAEAVFSTNPWSVIFRKSTDGQTFTAMGSTQTGTGPKLANNSTAILEVSGLDTHGFFAINGVTYDASTWNSVGTLTANPSFVGLGPNTTTFSDTMGNVWTKTGTTGYLMMGLDLYDIEAALGVQSVYRARAWRDDTDQAATGWIAGSTSPTLLANHWRLKDPLNQAVNLILNVSEFNRTRAVPAIVSEGTINRAATVTHGGARGVRSSARFRTLNKADYVALDAALRSGRTMLVQNILGEQWYMQLGDGGMQYELIRAQPVAGETTAIRHYHEWTVDMVEVYAP